jgi:hypothetical protein
MTDDMMNLRALVEKSGLQHIWAIAVRSGLPMPPSLTSTLARRAGHLADVALQRQVNRAFMAQRQYVAAVR